MAAYAERQEWIALADADTLDLLPKEALIATIKHLAERLLGLEPLESDDKPEMHEDPKVEQPPQKFGIGSDTLLPKPNQGGDRVFRLNEGLPI